ncbi:hypothetical protein K7X08_030962 [Anisodus acutangulus]|uniref:Uncharacterized protein n=1 Tax=Anisodus acutangulus TaxID=402998 RepID=A0A9Q1RR65_9SOLA|nr:hypothetical protein K7X08_030962 [Anisodus acutangulus]
MSASSRFDLSSSSLDRPLYLYASGQRGSYASASLDRSASFRENMENPILSSLPNMTRKHKLNRHSDFKRLPGLALGMPVEDSPVVSSKGKPFSSPFPEEARRLKAGLRESCTKARERVKIFTESLYVINKCFPSIHQGRDLGQTSYQMNDPMCYIQVTGQFQGQALVNHEINLAGPVSDPFDADGSSLVPNGFRLIEFGGDTNETQSLKSALDHMVTEKSKHKGISLYQRVMSALIPEDLYCSGNEDLNSDSYRSGFEMEMNLESDTSCAQLLYGSETSKYLASNGYIINANGGPFDNVEQVMNYNNVTSASDMGIFLLEYSDLAHTGDEEIIIDMSRLDEKHQEMPTVFYPLLVSKKKEMLGKLLNSAAETREFQEKESEHHALDKLVEMAYEKYMSCWGPNVHGAKSASGKMAKQAALALVKRTLDRCIQFEETGKSCFSETLYKDMFLSAISRRSDGQTDSYTDSEAAKSYFSRQQSPSLNQDILYDANLYSEASRVKRRELEDVLGKMSGQLQAPVSSIVNSSDISASGTGKDNNDYDLDELEDPIDLSGLPFPEMDALGVPDDLDGQGQDLGSWLNIDDDGLQDHDFMGLEIPMDDLSELNMMV